ncbi:ATP-dependent protease subunit HslV [Nymphon striatum]|nr:ATP-dependent protease subunit HslV [Nymphon striatum]
MTTIIGVRKDGEVVIAGDGQVSVGQTVMKGTATKVRKLSPGGNDVIAGFAGSTADAFTLLERLEKKLEATPGQLARASVDLAKDWRTDKYLQKLEAMLIVTDGKDLFVITGAGDVLEPEFDVTAIGSGGNYALAAGRALMDQELSAEDIARRAMAIASDICVYTNDNLTVHKQCKMKTSKHAAAAGIIDEAQAARLNILVNEREGRRAMNLSDDEPFELFQGFSEIFISIGLIILLSWRCGLLGCRRRCDNLSDCPRWTMLARSNIFYVEAAYDTSLGRTCDWL